MDGLDSSLKDYSSDLRFLLSAKGGSVFVIKGLPVLNNVMLKKLGWRMVTEDSMIFTYLHAAILFKIIYRGLGIFLPLFGQG